MQALVSLNITPLIREDLFKDYQVRLSQCPNCAGLFLLNKVERKIHALSCKAYRCPVCGPVKAYSLTNALEVCLSEYNHIRLFTFTFRTSIFKNAADCAANAGEIWRRFINNIRRNFSLSVHQRKFDYVKVLEFTKRGYIHFHCFVSEFLPWAIVQGIWNESINTVMDRSGKSGHLNIEHSYSATGAARYVAKYVLKTCQEKLSNLHVWSHSQGMVVFHKHQKNTEWHFVSLRSSNLNLSLFSIASQSQRFNHLLKLIEVECTTDIDNLSSSPALYAPTFEQRNSSYLE